MEATEAPLRPLLLRSFRWRRHHAVPCSDSYVDITGVADSKKAACYAHASQTPDFYYPLQDTVATFRGFQNGSKKAEAYILQLGSPYDIFPRTGISLA